MRFVSAKIACASSFPSKVSAATGFDASPRKPDTANRDSNNQCIGEPQPMARHHTSAAERHKPGGSRIASGKASASFRACPWT